jgi:predicted HTH domain antitoxin
MSLTLEIPSDLSRALEKSWGDVSRHALEAVAIEAYKSGAFTLGQVTRLLNHGSRWETEEFLRRAQCFLHYSEEDLKSDLKTFESLRDAGNR